MRIGRYITAAAISACIGAIAVPVHAGLPQWQPVGDWPLSLDGKHCFVGRTYTLKTKQVQLAIERNPTTGTARIYLISAGDVDEYGGEAAELTLGETRLPLHGLMVI